LFDILFPIIYIVFYVDNKEGILDMPIILPKTKVMYKILAGILDIDAFMNSKAEMANRIDFDVFDGLAPAPFDQVETFSTVERLKNGSYGKYFEDYANSEELKIDRLNIIQSVEEIGQSGVQIDPMSRSMSELMGTVRTVYRRAAGRQMIVGDEVIFEFVKSYYNEKIKNRPSEELSRILDLASLTARTFTRFDITPVISSLNLVPENSLYSQELADASFSCAIWCLKQGDQYRDKGNQLIEKGLKLAGFDTIPDVRTAVAATTLNMDRYSASRVGNYERYNKLAGSIRIPFTLIDRLDDKSQAALPFAFLISQSQHLKYTESELDKALIDIKFPDHPSLPFLFEALKASAERKGPGSGPWKDEETTYVSLVNHLKEGGLASLDDYRKEDYHGSFLAARVFGNGMADLSPDLAEHLFDLLLPLRGNGQLTPEAFHALTIPASRNAPVQFQKAVMRAAGLGHLGEGSALIQTIGVAAMIPSAGSVALANFIKDNDIKTRFDEVPDNSPGWKVASAIIRCDQAGRTGTGVIEAFKDLQELCLASHDNDPETKHLSKNLFSFGVMVAIVMAARGPDDRQDCQEPSSSSETDTGSETGSETDSQDVTASKKADTQTQVSNTKPTPKPKTKMNKRASSGRKSNTNRRK
jgi:hypothetical protein